MCRGKESCSVLGTDSNKWSRSCPLAPPGWFEAELSAFRASVAELGEGNRDGALRALSTIRDAELRDWLVEHGQMSGMHRVRILKLYAPGGFPEKERDRERRPTKFEQDVFARDGYRCRYCGIRIVSKKVLAAFERALRSDHFSLGPANDSAHGIVNIFKPAADHVVPWALGGRTNLENLVTSCGPCNYGKYNYTVEQMGVSDPRLRAPLVDDWDGLVSQLSALESMAA